MADPISIKDSDSSLKSTQAPSGEIHVKPELSLQDGQWWSFYGRTRLDRH